ncbi:MULTISPECIES: C40 family peptidase [Kitasatospora]|uniref:Putative peptidase C40 family protein n=1 Tax=Kitasatospora setae (strain ATCC 33774 / DSM 43861 / JCM 3304 / KCC A-0304 / NBRC 14216 / KM-6054) TaxID=452652 RepID=E4NJ98_KITSK|nr:MULTISPECIES: C40 family peptidase [Kitasatospora]BAJ33046.1 putative peptidase C40 family protein [Kitasatospora setae KM-6054]
MASHRRPKQPSRARVAVLTGAAATAVALSAQGGAQATPAQPNKDEVKAQVDKLSEEMERATEKYNGAKERSEQLRQQAGQLQDQVARGQEQLNELAAGLAAVAGDQYRQGGVDPSMQLMLSSDPDQYLAKATSFDQAAGTQAETLKSLKEQQRRLDQQKQEATAVLAELDSEAKTLNDTKNEVQTKLAESRRLLNQLSAADRAAILADEGGTASRGSDRVDVATLPKASGAATQTAIDVALAQRGKPYVWGAEGPNSFDCSGLMVYAYAKAGVSLPRTSQEQARVGGNVGRDWHNAQPGDLVIYSVHGAQDHVAMYLGNGVVVHAPKPGAPVRTMAVDALPISTIRRV